MMLGTTNIKFIDAQQTKLAYQYTNTKRKLYKTNAAIWYNKMCRQKRLTPKYVNIRINGNNQQCQRTHKAAIHFRINQEIKYLFDSAGSTTQNNKTVITYTTIELLYDWQIYNLSEPAYLWPYTAYVLLMMGEIVARNI